MTAPGALVLSGYGSASLPSPSEPDCEDVVVLAPPLFAVADGMGGLQQGAVAAMTAAQALVEAAPLDGEDLRWAVDAANRAVHRSTSPVGRAGTTICAVVVRSSGVWIASLGDSRAYAVVDGEIEPLTVDDAFPLAAGASAQSLARFAGDGRDPPQVRYWRPTAECARLVLATDGVHGVLSDDRIADVAWGMPGSAAATAGRLVATAADAGSDDDATVIVVDVTSTDVGLCSRR